MGVRRARWQRIYLRGLICEEFSNPVCVIEGELIVSGAPGETNSNIGSKYRMKIQANTIRSGNVIEHGGKQWNVLKTEMLLPGKGNAFVQVEMRDIKSGNKTNERFRTSETVEKLMVEETDATFLYAEDEQITFMDNASFEQFTLSIDAIGEPAKFLVEGMLVTAELIDGAITGIKLPQHVTMAVVEADPVVKGQTASSSYKPAVIENGVRVMVPPHIEANTRIVVSTEDGVYVERAKD